jgi:hypothetical protein
MSFLQTLLDVFTSEGKRQRPPAMGTVSLQPVGKTNHRSPSRPTKDTASRPTAKGGAGLEDRIMIVGFNSQAFRVLLPTRIGEPGVVRRTKELAEPRRFKGGSTNLSAGLDLALDQIGAWKGDWVKRIVIVSDGEPTDEVHRLSGLGDRARSAHASICAIHIGDGNNQVLRDLVGRTRGGWFDAVGSFNALVQSIRRAGQVDRGGNGRRALVIVLVDTSSSMSSPFPGAPGSGRRIDALVEAVLAWRCYHARTYAQFLGRAA